MNVVINNTCNRACPYCFARSKVSLHGTSASTQAREISTEDFEKCLDFHEASRIPQVKMLGGEPTLHLQFLDLARRAHERGFEILVFTNGLWPSAVQDAIGSIPMADWNLKFMFNVNEPHLQPASQLAHAKESMRLAGKQGRCGFNIYRKGFDLQFLPDLIDSCGLDRTVRLGLASPIAGAENSFVETKDLKATGARLVGQLSRLETRNVLASFDCGFPLCMFPEESLGSLVLATRSFQSVCRYPIDVGSDLTAWPCFPLWELEIVRLLDFGNADRLHAHFAKRLAGIRRMGIFDECLTCKYIEREQCCGGCVARTLRDWAAKCDPEVIRKLVGADRC